MFLRTDQFISSVRIEILFDLLALSWTGPTCPTCFLEISDGLRRCCVMSLGKPSCYWQSWFLCWNTEAVELFVSSYYFDEVLNSFRWCLQPDGKAVVQHDQLPVCQRASKKKQTSKSCSV